MKIQLVLFSFIALTLFADMFEDNEVSYAYDIMNKDDSIIKYLVDFTYYDQFSSEILGVYIIYDHIPMRITKDLKRMAEILDHYINLSSSNQEFKEIISTDVFEKFSEKYIDNHREMRDINTLLLMLRNADNYRENSNSLNKLENYINKKKNLYHRENNIAGKSFCNEIEKTILNPLIDYYINLSSSNQKNKFKEIISIDVFEKFSEKYIDNHREMRDINTLLLMLRNADNYREISNLLNKLENYINKKKNLYHRENNIAGKSFCNEIEKTILNPLGIINDPTKADVNLSKKPIKRLSKKELKIVWDEFKNSNLGLIKTYFDANNEKLVQLDTNNSFSVDLDYLDWNGLPQYYICLKIFGQKWYLKIDDYYVSDLHKVSLIRL